MPGNFPEISVKREKQFKKTSVQSSPTRTIIWERSVVISLSRGVSALTAVFPQEMEK